MRKSSPTVQETAEERSSLLARELWGVFLIALGLFCLVSVIMSGSAGLLGNALQRFLFGFTGIMAYIAGPLLILGGVMLIFTIFHPLQRRNYILFFLMLAVTVALAHLFTSADFGLRAESNTFGEFLTRAWTIGRQDHRTAGILGVLLGYLPQYLLGVTGGKILLITALAAIVLVWTGLSLASLGQRAEAGVQQAVETIADRRARRERRLFVENMEDEDEEDAEDLTLLGQDEFRRERRTQEVLARRPEPAREPRAYEPPAAPARPMQVFSADEPDEQEPIDYVSEGETETAPAEEAAPVTRKPKDYTHVEPMEIEPEVEVRPYVYPPFSLLTQTPENSQTGEDLVRRAEKLESTLASFGVRAEVVNVSCGPAITQFELQPGPGVRSSAIVNLSNDIALALAAPTVRIEAPIPGKSAIGVEVPNAKTSMVRLRDVIDTPQFEEAKSCLTFGLGRDVVGNNVLTDLAKMPHLLIAGATGSGKSVCMNTIIISVLYKATPQQVRMIMIDPKRVEFSNYEGIPHLLVPVVTEPKKAAGALNWAVQEMNRRYQLFAENRTRDFERFNETREDPADQLPAILILVDELADLMMVAPHEVEDAICRLAQMARAAGMYLVIATQRPSVDVITGLIKANIPSRIALTVASQVDSRTILDMTGAEKLLGHGDMLYAPAGAHRPLRVQGAYLSDEEVERVVAFVKEGSTEAHYTAEAMEQIESYRIPEKGKGSGSDAAEEGEGGNKRKLDALLSEAVDVIYDSGQASISMVQRRLSVGYARAARIIDQLEQLGIVAPGEGSKPRQILKTRGEIEEILSGSEEGE